MEKILNYQRCFKKVIGLFLAVITFLSTITNVYACILTMDNVASQFNQTTIIEGLAEFGLTVSSRVNTNDKTLDIYHENEKIFSFLYGDDYIEYNNRDVVVTEENCSDDIYTTFWVASVMEAILTLSGYENKSLSEDAVYTDTYDTYGIELETESYNFSKVGEDGESSSMSGEYLKYFKMSLDTEKIDALMATYGVDVESQDASQEVINGLTPTLEAKNITENSVALYPSINLTDTDTDYSVACYVYRSTSEDGTYEKISDFAVNCLNSVGIVDENLESNTTYYYKTIVDGGTIYSNPIEVVTKSETITETSNTPASDATNKSDVENPNTGVSIPIITTSILLIGGIAIICYTKKKNKFTRI